MSRQLRKKNPDTVISYVVDLEDDDDDETYEIKDEDSDEEAKKPKKPFNKASKGTRKESKIDSCKPKRNAATRGKQKTGESDAAKSEEKKPGTSRKRIADLKPKDETVISDDTDEDLKPKKNIPSKNRKRKGTDEPVAAKKTKTSAASTSKNESIAAQDALKVDSEKKSLSNDRLKDCGDNAEWSEQDYLSDYHRIDSRIADNILFLFKDDNTIPFIARYRKEMTGGMEPEELRSIKNTYDNMKCIKQRALVILKTIDKLGKWSPEIHSAVTAARSLDELEQIFLPYKPGSKRSLAERAKELGLSGASETILLGKAVPSLSSFVDTEKEGLRNEAEVRQSIVHIIADVISKDKTTFEGIRELRKQSFINIECTKSKTSSLSKSGDKGKQKIGDQNKYENYYNFVSSEKIIKDYQILAINRGESQKVLTVKTTIPQWFERKLKEHCLRKYNFVRRVSNFHNDMLEESFEDAYNRLIKKFISRQVRHDLNKKAESASIEVFANNLKKLLLTPPLRGKTVLGIDPGFVHGCKLAVVSHCGNVLDTATIYPHTKSSANQGRRVLADLVRKHSCTIVALGNATACRETETYLIDLIQTGAFAPLDVSYTIVNEAGASIYSCSSEAKTEFPKLDPNIISAISIARRLQDPLAELVKVEPKHLGVGMYQHDLPEKQLHLTLEEVITETVSFVGVDVNTASHCLLRRVAGLNAGRASSIIERRSNQGPFRNRQELLEVRGIGKKSFEQCAGFIRILPETALAGDSPPSKKHALDYLDQTWIHPESYDVARRFLKACKCELSELGSEAVIQRIKSFAKENLKVLAEKFGTSETSMDVVLQGLSMRKGEDIRVKEEAPLFRKNLRCIDDLCVNSTLTGSVRNVTNFGAFVDVGVGRDGLIPISKMKGQTLSLGQRVEVMVFSVDKERGRIALTL